MAEKSAERGAGLLVRLSGSGSCHTCRGLRHQGLSRVGSTGLQSILIRAPTLASHAAANSRAHCVGFYLFAGGSVFSRNENASGKIGNRHTLNSGNTSARALKSSACMTCSSVNVSALTFAVLRFSWKQALAVMVRKFVSHGKCCRFMPQSL